MSLFRGCLSFLARCLHTLRVNGRPTSPAAVMLEALASWIQSSGALVYVLAPAFTVAVAILPIPAEIPAMVNGLVFGPLWGTLVTWLSALVGAQISFDLARRYGRPLGERVLPARLLDRADSLVCASGWPVLLGLRLIPTVAFTAVNWAAGLTMLRRSTFVWTTAVGILPGAIVFTSAGSGIGAFMRARGRYSTVALIVTGVALIGFGMWMCRRLMTGSQPDAESR